MPRRSRDRTLGSGARGASRLRAAAPQTAGSFLKRFTLGHIRQLDKAPRAVHLMAFQLLGVTAGDRITLDFDSTYVRSYSSRREGADPTWAMRYTLHPLLCFVSELSTWPEHVAAQQGLHGGP